MNNNPLLDKEFLKLLYEHTEKEVYAKIIALTINEDPVEEIQGRVTSGSVNIDGSSAVRRTCSLSLVAQNMNIDDFYWGLNSKFKLEIGLKMPDSIKNKTETIYVDGAPTAHYPYKDYPDIIWFPQGTYLISSFSTSQSVNNYTINIQGKDKMCLLNGEISGSFFASIDFGTEEYVERQYTIVYSPNKSDNTLTPEEYVANQYYIISNGNYTLCKSAKFDETETYYKDESITIINSIPIKNIIMEGVHEYAREPFENIIINDLDDYGLELLEYRGTIPMYLYIGESDSNIGEVQHMTFKGNQIVYIDGITEAKISELPKYNPRITLDFSGAPEVDATIVTMTKDTPEVKAPRYTIAKIVKGNTCGYRLTDITYAGDLIGGIGESMTSILDKIVQMLGNFEYFYDTDGHFRFQKKQTFLDKSWTSIVGTGTESYVEPAAYTSANVWNFEGNLLLSAISNNPSLTNLKNDYSLWGSRKTSSGSEIPVHLRYAIDKKPIRYTNYDGQTYIASTDNAEYKAIYAKAKEDMTNGGAIEKAKIEIAEKGKSYYKTPNYNGLPEDWWEVIDWANYYKYLTGAYPVGFMYRYCTTSFDESYRITKYIPQPEYGVGYPNTNADYGTTATPVTRGPYFGEWTRGTPIFDINEDGTLGYTGHGTGCGHDYQHFLDWAEHGGVHSYFFKPQIPTGVVTEQVIRLAEENFDKYVAEEVEEIGIFQCDWRELIYQMAKDYRKHNHDDDFLYKIRTNNGLDENGNWYYPSGYTGYEQYYIDMEGFWRQLYCLPHMVLSEGLANIEYDEDGWSKQITLQPELLNFWFDILDPYQEDSSSEMAKYGIPTVGDRAKSVNDSAIKAIYFREVPTTLFTTDISTVDRKAGYTYIQYVETMNGLFNISSQGKSAKDALEDYLYKYAYCIENISITSIPLYHLEPNTRIYIHDENSNINGQYIINKITLPLGHGGTMSISATKAADRIY